MLRTCSQCRQRKPLESFRGDRSSPDGRRNPCKACRSKARRLKYATDPEFRRRHAEERKRIGNTRTAEQRRAYKLANPDAYKARRSVNKAVRRGTLPRPDTLPCSRCGKPASQYHHHKGYERKHWWDVVPVCTNCHGLDNRLPPG